MNRKLFGAAGYCLGAIASICALCTGCAYRGGKVVDGANLAIGMTIPGTEWSINALDYVGGVRVAGQDSTRITVANEVAETNDYFGVVTTRRKTRMSATIEPIPPACADGTNACASRRSPSPRSARRSSRRAGRRPTTWPRSISKPFSEASK